MASRALSPQVGLCVEKLRLTNELFEATRALMALHDQDLQSLMAGVIAERSDYELQQARDRRDNANMALLLHVREHAC